MRSPVSIIRWLLFLGLLLSPVIILPMFETADSAKIVWLSLVTACILLLWSVRTFKHNRAVLTWSWEALALGLLALSGCISLMVSSVQKIDAFISAFGPLMFLICTVILIFGQSLLEEKGQLFLRLGLGVEAAILGLIAIYQAIGLSRVFMPGVPALQSSLWSPTGSPVALLSILVLMLPLGITIAYRALKERKDAIAAGAFVGCGLMIAGIGVTLWQFVPNINSVLLPLPVGWSLMIGSWDSARHLLFGQGVDQVFSVFTKLRPQSLNVTPLWSTAFTANASLFLQVGTSMGLTGILALFYFLGCVVFACSRHPMTLAQGFIIVICVLFFPPTVPFWMSITILLLTLPGHRTIQEQVHGFLRWSVVLIPCLFALMLLIGIWRYTQAEYYYRQALTEADRGNGTQTYLLLSRAVQTNPLSLSSHIALSQTYLRLIAGILSASPTGADGTLSLSDEDMTLVTQLIGNAIKEGKIAVTLAPNNVYTWTNLAHIYQELVGIAKDADVWASAAYQKAIELDPTNPVLRLDYGGLFNKLDKFEEARQQFLTSVTLKPNYINGFYNLAYTFKKTGDWDNAIKTLEQTKQLTAKGSAEEQQIDIEIMDITKEKRSSEKPAVISPTPAILPKIPIE